jgi:hypothetical protein
MLKNPVINQEAFEVMFQTQDNRADKRKKGYLE